MLEGRLPARRLPTVIALTGFAVITLSIAGCRIAPATAPRDEAASAREGTLGIIRDPIVQPDTPQAHTALDALWPNDDGHFWTYRLRNRTFEEPQPHFFPVDAVPPAPSPAELAAWLKAHRKSDPAGVSQTSGTWTMRFEGNGSTLSGAQGQNLTETVLPDVASASFARLRSASVGRRSTFVSWLMRARPDLAPRIAARYPGVTAMGPDLITPILVHGYIWEKTADHIGTYGDVDLDLAWKFLEADLTPGHEFTFQLVPSLANDVFLRALVLPSNLRSRPASAPHSVEVVYVVDFGVSEGTDENGNFLGGARNYFYGAVTYVPGVGPVSVTERNLGFVGGTPDEVFVRIDASLAESGPGSSSITSLMP